MGISADKIAKFSSPRPWTYHNDGGRDWVEDANGNIILSALGSLDGPLIVACVNYATATGIDEEAVTENAAVTQKMG
jgi:hypothetical protein